MSLEYDWPDCRGMIECDSVEFNYSHCRNARLLFAVDYSIEIRLLWEFGGIWLKWCRERIELVRPVRASMIFPWCFPSGEILKFHFRILTFPSVCYAISQPNDMQGGCFQKIWSILVQFAKWWSASTFGLTAEVCLNDSVAFNYSHCINAQLLFAVDCSIEIRLVWEIGGIWLKWCRERNVLVRPGMIFPWCFPSEEILKFHFAHSHVF
jgi:hypothetical protein